MEPDKLRTLLLDNVYGLRTQQEVADLSGYSLPRISQKVQAMVRAATNRVSYRSMPEVVSAAVYRADLRNRAWADTPEAFYKYERGLTKEEF